MKIIDRTPFKGPDGKISAVDRVRGTLRYGSAWYDEVQAQAAAASALGRQLDRTYTLLINPQLPQTDVVLPMVLVGPPGVFMTYLTNERGVFQAQGEEWGTLSGERFVPAKANLLTRTVRMSQALGKFLGTQGFSAPIEPVLVATNPGTHIDSIRPIIRVVLSDGLERFAIGLTQGNRMLSAETVAAISDRIINPRTPKLAAPAAAQAPAGNAETISAESLGFAFDEGAQAGGVRPARAAAKPVAPAAGGRGGVRFSRGQWFALGCLFVVFVLILSAIIVLAVMNA